MVDLDNYVLDESLVSELRNVVYKTHLYRFDDNVKSEYSMICAVSDRIQDAIRWVNEHLEFPKDCVTAQTFLMLIAVVKSSVEALYVKLKVNRNFADRNNDVSYKFFGDVCVGCSLLEDNKIAFTDDEFFQYFRSLSFSHPQGTCKQKENYPFLKEGEIEYCPYVVIEKSPWPKYAKGKPSIGVHVYSNMRDESKYIFVPYESLLGYLKSRFESVKGVVEVLQKKVKKAERKFKKEQLTLKDSAKESLYYFKDILSKRGRESYALMDAIEYLECQITNKDNCKVVEEFRNEILQLVPKLKEELENLNYEDFERRLLYVVDCAWHRVDSPLKYHIGKVFEYFNGRNSPKREWGAHDLKILMDDFVGKWVKVSYDMPDLEIGLLVTVAFYMEYGRYLKLVLYKEEQENSKNLPRTQMCIEMGEDHHISFKWVEEEV